MTQVAQVDLPYPPSVNVMYRPVVINGTPRKILTNEGKKWKEHAVKEALSDGAKAVPGKVEIWVDLYPPDRRIRDADNNVKALFDALVEACLIEDDNNRIIIKHTVQTHEPDGDKVGFARIFIRQWGE